MTLKRVRTQAGCFDVYAVSSRPRKWHERNGNETLLEAAAAQQAREFQFQFYLRRAHQYTATVSYFPGSDRIAEIFLGNGLAGSDVDAAAKDGAVLASLCFQFGEPLDVLRKALLKDSQNRPCTPIACALDLLAERGQS